MSTNCINCGVNKRTGIDLLCDICRENRQLKLQLNMAIETLKDREEPVKALREMLESMVEQDRFRHTLAISTAQGPLALSPSHCDALAASLYTAILETMPSCMIAQLNEKVNELQDALQRLQSENRWIPVGEQLPPDYESIFFHTKDKKILQGYTFQGNWLTTARQVIYEVVAWHKYPTPPENQG